MASSNPVPIDLLDGKPRALKYGVRACGRIEREYGGRNIYSILRENEAGHEFILIFLWGGLLWAEPFLTIDGTAELLDDYLEKAPGARADKLVDLGGPIIEALMEAGVLRRAVRPNGAAVDPTIGETTEAPTNSPH